MYGFFLNYEVKEQKLLHVLLSIKQEKGKSVGVKHSEDEADTVGTPHSMLSVPKSTDIFSC